MTKAKPTPSPLDDFVAKLRGIAAGRRLMIAALPSSPTDWRIFVDDVEMMLHENVVIGLRSAWVRRVAIPVFKAWCMLRSGDGKPKERALKAVEILEQCTDDGLAVECTNWIRQHYTQGDAT